MTQYGYEPLSPSDSGSTLLERINGVVPALLTNHKGPSRPGYVQPGMMWIDDSGSEWLLNLYDGANDVAIAVIDPETHQALSQWVPVTRTIASGLGVKINGGDSATLAGTVTIGLDLATDPETIAGLLTNKAAPPSGVHAAIAAALAGFSAGGIKGVRLITASDSVTPSAGVTKWLYFLVDGGYNGSESGQGAQFKAGSGGPGGKGSIGLVSVDAATAYSVTIGARNGGATSFVVGGVTKTSTNGILNVPSAIEDSPPLVFNASVEPRWARGGSGGPGPFGFGTGGSGGTVSSTSSTSSGSPGTGYGAGGAGGSSGSTAGNTAGAAGSQGCLLILEF